MTKQIYLAGFDVFRQDAIAHGQHLQQLCAEYGFKGLYPLDNAAPSNLRGELLAQWIYQANIALIEQADAVIANLNPFRGHEPDSGTVFEVGYAIARRKVVAVYTEQQEQLICQIPNQEQGMLALDEQGFVVEDFGLNLNLMLACSVQANCACFEECLRFLQQHYARAWGTLCIGAATGMRYKQLV